MFNIRKQLSEIGKKIKHIINQYSSSDFVKNTASLFSTKAVLFITGMAASILSARLLGPEGKGIFAYVTVIIGLGVQFGNFGMQSANTYHLSRDKSLLPGAVGNSLAITGLVAVFSLLIYFTALFFPNFISVSGRLLIIAFAFIPLQLYQMFQQNIFIALGDVKTYNILELSNGSLYPLLFVILAILGMVTPFNALCASFFSCAVIVTAGFIIIKRGFLKERIHFNKQFLQTCLQFGIFTYISTFIMYMLTRADIFLIDFFLDKTQTGKYSVAVQLSDLLIMIISSVGILMFPKISSIQSDYEKFYAFRKIIITMTVVIGGCVFIGILISGFAIPFLYGYEFNESINCFRILLTGAIFYSYSSFFFNFFMAMKKLRIIISAPLTALVINFLLNIWLIPEKQIIGAAAAKLIAFFCMALIMVMYYTKLKRVTINTDGFKEA